MGEWMRINGEAVKGTEGSPFLKVHRWGSLTYNQLGNAVYLHLYDWDGGDIVLNGLKSRIVDVGILGSDARVALNQDIMEAQVTIELPEENKIGPVPVIKLILNNKPQFDLSRGPDYEPEKVEHVTAAMLRGTITAVDGIRLTVSGKRNVSSKTGYEEFDDKETTIKLSLNDHVRFRTSREGDIRSVQGFYLVPGQDVDIVYTPHKGAEPELEIITLRE
jgi:hypothetical protein